MSDQSKIRMYWKPDGKTIHSKHDSKIRAWLKQHALSTAPGALTVVLHSPVHESARKHLTHALAAQQVRDKVDQ